MKILIIEDSHMVQMVVKFNLSRMGCQVVTANDGKEGMEKIVEEKPDLIVSDLMMPFVNGMEIIHFVRVELRLETPIIILSAIEQEESIIQALELGADDYVTKPFSPTELLLRIRKIVKKR